MERFIYGAPVFAPLLFSDLAVLAAIGLAALLGPGPNSYGARWTGASGS